MKVIVQSAEQPSRGEAYEPVERVHVIIGGAKFIVERHDEQTIRVTTAADNPITMRAAGTTGVLLRG